MEIRKKMGEILDKFGTDYSCCMKDEVLEKTIIEKTIDSLLEAYRNSEYMLGFIHGFSDSKIINMHFEKDDSDFMLNNCYVNIDKVSEIKEIKPQKNSEPERGQDDWKRFLQTTR